MRVLITGGAGFIGSHVVQALLAAGHEVSIIENFDPYYAEELKRLNLQHVARVGEAELIVADITDFKTLSRAVSGSYDALIHLAGLPGVRASMSRHDAYFQSNVGGTLNVLELARQRNMGRVVFASSSSVYGGAEERPWNERHTQPEPLSPYGRSKLMAEALGEMYSTQYGLPFTALRLFSVYGPRQRPDLGISLFARAILENREISIFGDGTAYRDYTYIDDVVRAILRSLQLQSLLEIINVASGAPYSVNAVIRHLEQILGRDALVRYEPVVRGESDGSYGDISRAREQLDYEPTVALHQGLETFCDWLQPQLDVISALIGPSA